MNFTIKSHIPHGVTPLGDTGPFTPANVSCLLRDYSTVSYPVVAVPDEYKLVLDLSGNARAEDIIAIDQRDECPSGS